MKILLSALACEPGIGSELEVGFRALLTAASRHEVWVITNSASIPIIRAELGKYPWAARVHLEGIYFEVDDELYPQLTTPGFHFYYDRWQRKAAVRARELDERVNFDVIHHATLAASWTRAGVIAVDKPLVWGPVGGGVEMPLSLLPELGVQGVLEEAARTVVRRILCQVGPAHLAQQRAVVIFAQNRDTARTMRTLDRVRVLSNATSVDIPRTDAAVSRRKDIVFASRLLPWKGGRLAVRALKYVKTPDATLRIYGNGPERRAIARVARRLHVADRVRFEGWVRREELLRLVATAGVFLHPAFHDEAGLAVAEALSLGTPVVCLDRGGPPELLHYWPDARAQAVRPQSAERTARAMAEAIDRFLADPPPIQTAPQRAVRSFESELLAAYDIALDGHADLGRRPGWAFPVGKPQVFALTPRALSKGVLAYGFGRRLPRVVQIALSMQVRVPMLRRLVAERRREPPPVCGWRLWHALEERLLQHHQMERLQWVQFQSQWGKKRSYMLGFGPEPAPRTFVVIEPEHRDYLHDRLRSTASFRVAACTGAFVYEGWSVRQYEPLPSLHGPAKWDPERIRRVAEDVSFALEGLFPKPARTPKHWRPIHGDFVPWNLREDSQGQLWLLDWEDAGWGPPLADLVRYVVAYHSLGWMSPVRIAETVRRTIGAGSVDALAEIASFWLSHPNFQAGPHDVTLPEQSTKDSARAAREVAAFRSLAHSVASGERSSRPGGVHLHVSERAD
jgi:glycosyltransferase involved in cell wall biosynthesis/thiamine kinase-like enzyme